MRLADDAALGSGQETEHQVDVGLGHRVLVAQLGDLAARIGQRQALPVQQLVHLLDGGDALGGVAAPSQAFLVDALRLRRVAGRGDERRHVL
jgi:hypothetical protein